MSIKNFYFIIILVLMKNAVDSKDCIYVENVNHQVTVHS